MVKGPVIGPGIPTADGIESWGDTTVTFATDNVEAMPLELSTYLALGASLLDYLVPGQRVVTTLEPDWDGCDGRWLTIEQQRGLAGWYGSICAVALLDPGRLEGKGVAVPRAEPILANGCWMLVTDSTPSDPWGYWQRSLPSDPTRAAGLALQPALALFAVYEPRRWYLSMAISDSEASSVDLRAWRYQQGLAVPGPTRAPVGTEPWAIACDCGYHELHEQPCWDQTKPWPAQG